MSIGKFLVKKDPIVIELKYIEVDDEAIIVNDVDVLSESGKEKLKTMKAKFRRPSFDLFNKYVKDAVQPDGDGGSFVNFNVMRKNKFSLLFQGIEDHDGEVFDPVKDPKIISELHPEIASALMEKLDTIVDEARFNKMINSGLFSEKKSEKDSGEPKKDSGESKKDSGEPKEDGAES